MGFILGQHLWWLGIIAGFCAGYISYEFDEVLKSLPTRSQILSEIKINFHAYRKAVHGANDYFCRDAIARLSFVFGGISATFTAYFLCSSGHANEGLLGEVLRVSGPASTLGLALWAGGYIIMTPIIMYVANEEGHYFLRPEQADELDRTRETYSRIKDRVRYDEEVLKKTRIELTVPTVVRMLIKAVFMFVCLMIVGVLQGIAESLLGMMVALATIYILARKMIITVHSNQRVLCGLDGAIGGSIAFLTLTPTTQGHTEITAVVLCGGIVGVAVGTLHYRIARSVLFA